MVEAGRLRGTEAPFSRDELIAVDGLGDQDGLEDAVLDDARGERRQALRVESLARLMGVGTDPRCRDLERPRLSGASLRDERGEAAAESLRTFRPNGHDVTIALCVP
jgi:hypothetical protein